MFQVNDTDLGFKKLSLQKSKEITLEVGVLKDSPRSQFARKEKQQFKKETVALILDSFRDNQVLFKTVSDVGKDILQGKNVRSSLAKIGSRIQSAMISVTDRPEWGGGAKKPRPQLASAITYRISEK